MPDFREIISDIKKNQFAPVYILMGEEPYYIDKIMEALELSVVAEEDKEFDQSVMYGADADAGMVIEAASMFPMVSAKRYVALKEAQAMYQAENNLDKLKTFIGSPNPSTVLAIAFKGKKIKATSELLKAAKKNKDVIIFDSPKIRDYQLGGKIKDYCHAEKISIEDKAIELLVAHIGPSLDKLFSEIEKLKVAVKDDVKRITASMVLDMTGISREYNNFELVSALARRDYYQSVSIIRHFEVNPKANPTVVTASQIFRLFQQLVVAAFSPDKSDRALMEALQLKTPYALRDIRTGLMNYNASQLVQAIHAIRQFDTKSKGVDSFQKEFPLLLELVCTILTL